MTQTAAGAALAAQIEERRKAAAEEMAKNAEKHAETKKLETKTYYSRIAGSTHIFKNGKIAQFVNGEYLTNRAAEIEELEELCDCYGNHTICRERVPIQNISDAVVAREVRGSGSTPNHQVVVNGMVNTAQLNNLAAQ